MSKLEDKMALVTGASPGIGRANCAALAARRLTRRRSLGERRDPADETVLTIESSRGAAFAVGADLGSLSGEHLPSIGCGAARAHWRHSVRYTLQPSGRSAA
jgi:3-oxoacyl-[acyl-carrier protein] reductase